VEAWEGIEPSDDGFADVVDERSARALKRLGSQTKTRARTPGARALVNALVGGGRRPACKGFVLPCLRRGCLAYEQFAATIFTDFTFSVFIASAFAAAGVSVVVPAVPTAPVVDGFTSSIVPVMVTL
jgi:hypothetical protein